MDAEGPAELSIPSILGRSWPFRARAGTRMDTDQQLADERGPELVVEADDRGVLNLGAGNSMQWVASKLVQVQAWDQEIPITSTDPQRGDWKRF